MSRSWTLFLRDMHEAAEKIVRFTKGMRLTEFRNNELVFDHANAFS